MTPDEQVRAIHRLEGDVTRWRHERATLLANQAYLERQMRLLLTQQNALLAAIRGLEGTPVPQ